MQQGGDREPQTDKARDRQREAQRDDPAQGRREQLGAGAGERDDHDRRLLREPPRPANAEARSGLWDRAVSLYSATFLPEAPRGLSMNSAAIDVVGIGNA